MAAPPELGGIVDSLPAWMQSIITGAIAVGAVIGTTIVYVARGRKPEPDAPKPNDLVITAASLTDTGPLREMAKGISDLTTEMRGTRHVLDAIHALLLDDKHDRENAREIERQVDARLIQRAQQIGRKPTG